MHPGFRQFVVLPNQTGRPPHVTEAESSFGGRRRRDRVAGSGSDHHNAPCLDDHDNDDHGADSHDDTADYHADDYDRADDNAIGYACDDDADHDHRDAANNHP